MRRRKDDATIRERHRAELEKRGEDASLGSVYPQDDAALRENILGAGIAQMRALLEAKRDPNAFGLLEDAAWSETEIANWKRDPHPDRLPDSALKAIARARYEGPRMAGQPTVAARLAIELIAARARIAELETP
jgi:hypothetical protein